MLLYFSEKFPGAASLPFAAFMTHDFQFVHGFTGARTVQEFMADLDIVEKSPLLPATAEDAKKLVVLGEKASAAADEGDLATILKLGRQGAALRGRCDERATLDDAVRFARDWAESEFARVERELLAGVDHKALQGDLRGLGKTFKGEPEADVAAMGAKAVALYTTMAKSSGDKADEVRAKGAEQFAGTRWGPLFGAKGVTVDEPSEIDESD